VSRQFARRRLRVSFFYIRQRKLIFETINERLFFYGRKQMSKEILGSTNSNSRVLDILFGSFVFLLFSNHALGRRASILLICGGILVLVAGLAFQNTNRQRFSIMAVLLVAVGLESVFVSAKLWARYQINASCCQLSLPQSLIVSAKEKLELATFYSQMGQDKWPRVI
jgi:hypothetical protein